MDFRAIISFWGSADRLAKAIGAPKAAARHWYERNHINSKYWRAVLEAAPSVGLDLSADDLIDIGAFPSGEGARNAGGPP